MDDKDKIIKKICFLFEKSLNYLFKNISGNINESIKKKFIELLSLQLLVLWFLQKKELFNKDKYYFITKFEEIEASNYYQTYWEFLGQFFTNIINNTTQYYFDDKFFGKISVISPAIFIEDYLLTWSEFSIPNHCFYQKGYPNCSIDSDNANVSEIPLLNLFKSIDWGKDDIEGFVFGTIYEKLLNITERKTSGSYYTPEIISEYICKKTLDSYIIDTLNAKFDANITSVDEFIKNSNQRDLLTFFHLLKEIKILDPSVGSGHFLETAIKVLLRIYEKIWLKMKTPDTDIKFDIQILSDKGTTTSVNLLKITNSEYYKFLIVFHIILPHTLYGTDISFYTLKITKARLFLILTNLYNQSNALLGISNIKFNLYEGNAFFGQTSLEMTNLLVRNIKYQKRKISAYTDLLSDFWKSIDNKSTFQEFLSNALQSLEHETSIIKLIVDPVVYEDKLIAHLMMFNLELVKIINMSLTTSFFQSLRELHTIIIGFLRNILIEEFGNLNSFDFNETVSSKPIFWPCIFPEVFRCNSSGFDIIIGNPPYGAKLSTIEKVLLKKTFVSVSGIDLSSNNTKKKLLGDTNSAIAFTELTEHLSNEKGKIGLVIPKSVLYVKSWQSLRYFLINNTAIESIIDISKGFANVKLEEIIIIFSKMNIQKKNYVLCGKLSRNPNKIELRKVDKKNFSLERFLISMNDENEHIYTSIMNNTIELGKICNNKRGSENNRFRQDKKFQNSIIILDGKNIQPYYIRSQSYILQEHILDKPYYKYGTIIIQRIIAHVKRPLPHIVISATLNPGYPNINTIVNIFAHPGKKIRPKVIVLLLNSEIVCWYVYLFIFSEAVRSMDLWGTYLDQVHIPHDINNEEYECIEKIFEILSLYTTYGSRIENIGQEDKNIIEYFKELANLIAYELYLKDKLNTHLFKILQKINMHLKIDFDHWYQFEQFNQVNTWILYIEEIKSFYYQIKVLKELENEKNIIKTHPIVKYIRKNFI